MNATNNRTVQNPKTLLEATRYFADLDNAHKYLVGLRWADGVCCPRCGSTHVSFVSTRRIWKCLNCPGHKQFSAKTGTIMEESPLSLDKWMVAIWLEANSKNSISSYELHRALGITQKSAWFVLHRVRAALKSGSLEKMGGNGGIVEADETYVGGLAKNMHPAVRRRKISGSGGKAEANNKTAVMGLLDRHSTKPHSTVRAQVVQNVQRETLHSIIHKNVNPGSALYTDAWQPYRQLDPKFIHEFIDHAEGYVRGAVHTNGIENFWALFKRCIKGTHVSVEPFHLEAHVDSEAFRFNNRELNDGGRFVTAMKGIEGKRLTYKQLTGKIDPEGLSESASAGVNA
ncbi:MAG: IS1595 family transposase [Tepidisphaeraceae bacterium]|jgi:transposase-like protein